MQKNGRININRVIALILLLLGGTSIGISAFNASSYLAILGVSFIFWGAIILYIMPSKQVPTIFLTASNSASMSNIQRIMLQLKFTEKGIYLPPKNLHEPESSLIFIPRLPNQPLPQPDETKATELMSTKEDALFLTPPGYALSKLYEQKLGSSFVKNDLATLQNKLPKIIVEDLGIAESIEIQSQNSEIIVEVNGNLLSEDCLEARNYSQSHNSIGCLLSSSFACVLSKVMGEPIIIKSEKFEKNAATVLFTYQVLEE
jgi:hypothetical protein